MGTSGASKGPGSDTPLVPSWLNEPIAADPEKDRTPQQDGQGDNAKGRDAGYSMPSIPSSSSGRFQSARTNFSRFAASGGKDIGALRRGIRDYVRSGTGGSRNAVLRMGASLTAASGILSVFRGFQRDGIDATLRHLNLTKLVGRPPEDVFLGLTDVIFKMGAQSTKQLHAKHGWKPWLKWIA